MKVAKIGGATFKAHTTERKKERERGVQHASFPGIHRGQGAHQGDQSPKLGLIYVRISSRSSTAVRRRDRCRVVVTSDEFLRHTIETIDDLFRSSVDW